MSCYFRQNSNCEITIPTFNESSSGVTYYDIKVRVGQVEWLVERRYKDFDQLNEKLVEEISISKKLLPPKKIVGNKNPAFLEQRRVNLEKYLKELLVFFRIQLPRVLAEFLEFNKYDIIYLLQDLAKLFNESGETLLSAKKEFHFSALEVYAISERLNLPCPPESIEQRGKFDFSHVLDFSTQLEIIKITPVKNNESFGSDYNAVDVPIGRSNIIPKNLKFNLNAFRNLKSLKIYALPAENIIDIDILKPSLQQICVHNTTITSFKQVLLCDNVHKDTTTIDIPSAEDISLHHRSPPSAVKSTISTNSLWRNITELDFTCNLLQQIDESIRTVPQIRTLNLEQNRLRSIKNLAELPHLQLLNLSINLITEAECIDWHLELGNLVTLNLAQNKLKSVKGLRRMFSLINLDLSCNLIDDLEEVDNVACLPLLETLRLTGNPLASSVDYRPRVLARFHSRASEIILDSEKGTHKELDTALVLSALLTSQQRQQKSQQ